MRRDVWRDVKWGYGVTKEEGNRGYQIRADELL